MFTIKKIFITRSVIDSVLTYMKIQHPREGILLIRGITDKDEIHVREVVIPPFSVHGNGFSNFPLHILPFDMSIIGTAHSHPSGVLHPSIEDLNHFYGRIMIITGYPYDSENQIVIFDGNGKAIKYETIDIEDDE